MISKLCDSKSIKEKQFTLDKVDEYSDLDVVIATDAPERWLYGDCQEKLGV